MNGNEIIKIRNVKVGRQNYKNRKVSCVYG